MGAYHEFALANFAEASAFPHGSTQSQTEKKGDVVLVDCGCAVEGYQSDISRTIDFWFAKIDCLSLDRYYLSLYLGNCIITISKYRKMTKKAVQTASFMVRFTQKIYEENGESKVQWRGNVSHVQGGDDMSFSDFKEAVAFIQQRLADLTLEATNDRTSEEQDNILTKSFMLFKSMAASGPKILKETLKDPKKQVAHLQDQLSEYGEELLEKVPLDQWRNASKSDFRTMEESLITLTAAVFALSQKVDALTKAGVEKKGNVSNMKARKKPSTGVKKTATKAKTPPTKKK